MGAKSKNQECPYCKEEIKENAIKCKNCKSSIEPEMPEHEGICPYCKEEIKIGAIKCKHCKSNLTTDMNSECGCGGTNSLARQLSLNLGTVTNRADLRNVSFKARTPVRDDGICWYYSCGTCPDGTVMMCTDVIGCPSTMCSDIVLPTNVPPRPQLVETRPQLVSRPVLAR